MKIQVLFLLTSGFWLAYGQPVRPLPSNPHGPLKAACESCHTTSGWSPIRANPEFNHNLETNFPLRGMHEGVACSSCHVNKVFAKTATECASCHADLHRRQFGAKCEDCHTVQGWRVAVKAVRDHLNRFPLLGAHALATCESCHKGAAAGVYVGLNTDCFSCHRQDYQTTRPLDHVAAKLPTRCETCHGMDTFRGGRFDHTQFTSFPLLGAHARTDCAACHTGGRFVGTPVDCFSCHAKEYTDTKDPSHVTGRFPKNCDACHTMNNWDGAVFDHNTATTFPLTGAHTKTACAQCHINGQFTGTSRTCVGCHLADFQKATNPDHRGGNFSTTCETCHTTAQWLGAQFDHSLSRFPLTGAHTKTECASCHVGGRFTGTPSQCYDCHKDVFATAKNPEHLAAGFPTTCVTCHTTVQWTGASFDHNTTKFALTGKHTTVVCQQCHVGGKFAGTPLDCASCHLIDFNKTTLPPHAAAGFPTTCETCHTTVQWAGGKFDHNTSTKFPLTGKHTTTACQQCHVADKYVGLPQECASCHMVEFNNTSQPNHKAAGFAITCATCHNTSLWTGGAFDHNTSTKFPLTGKHIALACQQCHVGDKFAGTPMACEACHMAAFNTSTNPNHRAAGFPVTCATCHTTTQWQGGKFDHSTATKFPLTGKHVALTCQQCHVNGQFAGVPQNCAGCHLADYQKTTNPKHSAAKFSQDCATCHTTAQWNGAPFDHNKTLFPLTGKHVTATCQQCHATDVYSGISIECESCHMPDYQKAANPNHVSAGFPTTCKTCHVSTVQWTGAKFDHNATRFPLTGKHTTVQCTQCHVNGVFKGTSQDCASCHLTDYNKTTSPAHKAAGFPTTCESCHTTAQWLGAKFDHSAMTKFPLTGKHVSVLCTQCHVNGVFKGTPQDCASCHVTDYNKTVNPAHKAAGFPTTCETCHTTAQWLGAKFDHSTMTKFPLTGKHTTVLCTQCHINGVYKGTPVTCVGCHLAKYQATTNPNHVAAGYPTSCEQCHTTAQWTGAKFDHSATRFPLTGKHTTVLCAQCHVNSVYKGTPTTCVGCHLAKYQATTNPNHVAAGYPTTCEQCHTTAQWTGAKFDHSATRFPLTGKHTAVLCAQCHVNGVYKGTPMTCVGCHLAKYQATSNPNHVAAGFPTTCENCHTTAQWPGAKFDHNTMTKFPLTGKHTSVQCAQCHVNSVYKGTPTNCVGCHLAKYQATTNPNHVSAGFPTNCEMCHTTAQWPGAKFDHTTMTKFPLTGKHTTVLCAQCHINGVYKGTPSTCVGCHLAKYQATTNPNHVTAGFPTTCETCHTTAQWPGAKFDHTAMTKFPLTGQHTSVQCAQCHINGVYKGTPTTCVGCHLAKYQATTNPNHVAAGYPTTCEQCHTTANAGWAGATFDHSTTRFPLTGKHTTVLCAQCHVNGIYRGTPMVCSGCHMAKYTATTSPNHVAAGFPITCETCHTTAQWPGAKFDHSTATKFPLTGMHIPLACAQCHVNNVFKGTPTTCVGCHLAKYQATTSPNHISAGYPTTCEQCHTTANAGWAGAVFNHTTFPLTGMHTTVACALCHVNNVFKGTPNTCVGCHLAKYQATTNPQHSAAGFPTTCETCHTTATAGWLGAVFNHTTSTTFPLTGAHPSLACSACHAAGVFKGLATTCVSCHLAKYTATTNPSHAATGYPTTCEQCHSTTTWLGAVFSHTTFPLTGKHATVLCSLCHVNNVFKGTPTLCYSCHKTEYTTVTNPNHAAAGFPTTCETCHTTTAWTGAVFTHSKFPIYSGSHNGKWTTCADCHTNSANYTVFACTNCHAHDKTTMDAKHSGNSKYVYNSINCYSCHPNGST